MQMETKLLKKSKYNFHIYDSNKNELGYTQEEIMSLYYEFNVYNALTGEILFNISKQPDMVDSYKIVKKQDSDISMKDIIFLTCIIDAIEQVKQHHIYGIYLACYFYYEVISIISCYFLLTIKKQICQKNI